MGRGDHSHVIVGNLAFTVTEDELREVMEKFGKVVSLTIPRSRNNKSKGLGIVDFETGEEADKAHEALHEKELFGRKCFISFGDTEEFRRERSRDRDRDRDRDRRDRDRYRRRRRHSDYSDYSDYDYSRRRSYRSRHRDYDYSRSRRRYSGSRDRRRSPSYSDDSS